MTVVDVRTLRAVELAKVGTWGVTTGEWTVTSADLAAAIEAHQAGVLRKPVVKIGHHDPRFDGQPALGYVDNLRLIDSGDTLIGDLVNVPAAVATLIPHAYPDRSVEAYREFIDSTGRTWPLVLTGLALLGATDPGINTLGSLADIGALYGIAAARRVISTGPVSNATKSVDRPRAVTVAAARRTRNQRLTTKG